MKDRKKADTSYNIHPLIAERWSPRAFSDQPVARENILKLFDAARWAASSFNEQPWRFLIGMKGDDSYNKLLETLAEFNRQWAYNAPVLIIACGKNTFSKNGKENRHYAYDTGQAMANLALQATADNLYIHQMAGFSRSKAVELFSIPEDFEPLAACALGHLGNLSILDEKNQKSEAASRSRKPLDEIIFTEEWERRF